MVNVCLKLCRRGLTAAHAVQLQRQGETHPTSLAHPFRISLQSIISTISRSRSMVEHQTHTNPVGQLPKSPSSIRPSKWAAPLHHRGGHGGNPIISHRPIDRQLIRLQASIDQRCISSQHDDIIFISANQWWAKQSDGQLVRKIRAEIQ
ncbi:hypothetical protein ACLOJK_034735 [Asimina triloba]